MARFWPAADGTCARFAADADEEQWMGPLPAGVGAPVAFDEATNAALVADLRASTDAYRVAGGALQKNGQPVALAADSDETAYRKDAANLLNGLRQYVALAAPTAAQTAAAVKAEAKLLLYLARALQQRGLV